MATAEPALCPVFVQRDEEMTLLEDAFLSAARETATSSVDIHS